MITGTTPRETRELVPRGFYIDGDRMTVVDGNAAVIELAAVWIDYQSGEDVAGIVAAIRALDTAGDNDASDYFADLLGEIATDAVDAINDSDALEPLTCALWDGDAGGFMVAPILCDRCETNSERNCDADDCYLAAHPEGLI